MFMPSVLVFHPHEETVCQYFCCVSLCTYVHIGCLLWTYSNFVFETGLLIEPRAPVCFGVAIQEAQRWILVSLPSQC